MFPQATSAMNCFRFLSSLILLGSLAFVSQAQAEVPDQKLFGIRVLSLNLVDPMEITVVPGGRVFIAERTGNVKLFDPKTLKTEVVLELAGAKRQGAFARECG